MKVKELIEALQKQDPELDVWFSYTGTDNQGYSESDQDEVDSVDLFKGFKNPVVMLNLR